MATPQNGPLRVIGYTRVSTDKQAESGAGLEAQEVAIRSECERRGWELVRIATDVGSGKSIASRVALNAAVADLDSGSADALVASKLDRVSRNVPDFARLMEQAAKSGWAIVMLDMNVDTTTPSGELLLNVMSCFAQFERRVIGQRTKVAMAVKKSEGVHCGRTRKLAPAVVERISAERAAGQSYGAIARQLNAEGVPTSQGGAQWHASSVRAIALAVERQESAA
jgi:DNA invertase Pin-like site-specific DNA recombinase